MSVVPDKSIDKLQFFENHITPWTTNAVAIGTTSTIMTDLATKTTAARAAFTAQQAAQEVAKSATQTWANTVIAMAVAGSAVIKQIRAKAAIAGVSVYSLAQIPPPATPTPAGAPGTPSDFTVAPQPTGELDLAWKCTSPAGGTVYQIWRRSTPTAEFEYLGGSGEKKFTDSTLPAGSSQVTYQIQGVRSTGTGPWAQFNVNFGVGSGGATVASVEETAGVTSGAVRKAA